MNYAKEEIIPASKAAKNLGSLLKKINDQTLTKAVISRNNNLEAVLLSIDDYEILQEIKEMVEQYYIAEIIAEREKSKKTISLDKVFKKYKITHNEIQS